MYFCTSFCNFGHSLRSGIPLDHECYVLPVLALGREMGGFYEEAAQIIAAAKPLRVHPGTRCRHVWERRNIYTIYGYAGHRMECSRCGLEKTQ